MTIDDHESDEPGDLRLAPWEHLVEDEHGEYVERDEVAHAEWVERWTSPCPDGHPQEVRQALGFRERNSKELELRVLLSGSDYGVCDVIVDEWDDEVHVRVLVCYRDDDGDDWSDRDYLDCPVRTWLDRPLGERAVIDVDSDEELPLYTPSYLNNIPQADAGYRPANRRGRRGAAGTS